MFTPFDFCALLWASERLNMKIGAPKASRFSGAPARQPEPKRIWRRNPIAAGTGIYGSQLLLLLERFHASDMVHKGLPFGIRDANKGEEKNAYGESRHWQEKMT